jgi:hypothetical protein
MIVAIGTQLNHAQVTPRRLKGAQKKPSGAKTPWPAAARRKLSMRNAVPQLTPAIMRLGIDPPAIRLANESGSAIRNNGRPTRSLGSRRLSAQWGGKVPPGQTGEVLPVPLVEVLAAPRAIKNSKIGRKGKWPVRIIWLWCTRFDRTVLQDEDYRFSRIVHKHAKASVASAAHLTPEALAAPFHIACCCVHVTGRTSARTASPQE